MSSTRGIVIRVGTKDGDIVGSTNRALQAAVDYVAALGGGTVEIGPGEYWMTDSLHLRSNVTVVGAGPSTVLKKCAGVETPLATDGDYGEEQITVVDPTGFEVGGGVTISPRPYAGSFMTTVATIVEQIDENTFRINKPLNADCQIQNGAKAQTTFPVISAYHISGATVQDLAIDGNAGENPYLGGNRGAGVYLYRAHNTQIRRVTVLRYRGDGISYQQSDDVVVDECTVLECDKGIHPGSGSTRTIIRNCRVCDNQTVGLYLCWRVRHSLIEGNEICNNGVTGISIGHKDTDNEFRRNVVAANGRHGVLFRNEPYVLAGHRNRFESNRIVDNGDGTEGYGFYIDGETDDITITGNVIGNTDPNRPKQVYGIYVCERARRVALSANEMLNMQEALYRQGA